MKNILAHIYFMKKTHTIEKNKQHVLYVLFSYYCNSLRTGAYAPLNILSIFMSDFRIAFINFACFTKLICLG